MENKLELNKFLVEAKRNTYASDGESREIKLFDGGRELIFENGIYKYRDRYYGSNPFSGQEVVWQNEIPIWSMNYYGQIIKETYKTISGSVQRKITIDEIYDFLKKALRNVSVDSPYRGPSKFEFENLNYFRDFWGDLEMFRGKEFINNINTKVYCLYFHGGLIQK